MGHLQTLSVNFSKGIGFSGSKSFSITIALRPPGLLCQVGALFSLITLLLILGAEIILDWALP